MSFIHPSAFIEDNVSIGAGSKVWHNCQLRENCTLGKKVSLGKGVFIDASVSIGDGSRIQNGVSVYKGVRIDKWCLVGPNVTFTNDIYPRVGVEDWKLTSTILSTGCSIGAGSIICPDIKLGFFSMIGAGSIVTSNVPDFHLAYGAPARIISKICACGKARLSYETPKNAYIQECCTKRLSEEVLNAAKEVIEQIN